MTMATAAGPRAATPAPIGRHSWTRELPQEREWLIALLMLLLPIERVLVVQAGTITIRPVFAVMALIIGRELAVRDWPWAASRPAQQLMRGVLVGIAGIAVALATGVWTHPSLGYCLWLAFSGLFMMAMVRTITIRADLDRWAHWAVTAATFWSGVALVQWVVAASVLPSWGYSFLGPLPRVHALTYEPSFLALYLLPHIFLAHQTGRRRALWTITLALVLSTSRLGLIGLTVGLAAILLLDGKRRRRTLRLAGALAVGIALLTSLMFATGAGRDYTRLVSEAFNSAEQSSTAPRLDSWEQAWSLAGANMPFGVGPGGYGEALHDIGVSIEVPADELKTTNLWLETLAEIGVPGALALLAWSIFPLARLRRRTAGAVPAGLFLGGIAVLATFPLFQTWERPQLWVWWGLVWAAAVMPAHGLPAVRTLRRPRRPVRRSSPVLARIGVRRGGEVARAGVALSGRVAATAAAITLTIVTARALGPADRGVLVLAILAGYLASIPIRSASATVAYELGLVHRGVGGAREGIIADSWRMTAIAFGAVTVASGVVLAVTGWGLAVALIGAATLAGALIISTPYGITLADGRMGRLALITAGFNVMATVGALLSLVIGGADLLHVAVGWATGAIVGSVVCLDRPALRGLRRRRRAGSVRRQLKFSVKAAGTTLITSTANRTDILLLGLLSTTTSVGLYSVAIGASELVWFAGEALAVAAYGRIGAGAHLDAVRATWRLCGLTTLAAAIQAVVLALIAHDAMAAVFGEEFRQSGTYLQILLVGSVLGAAVFPVSNYLTNQLGRPLLALTVAGATLGATALACLVTIPRWGASGAAAGSSIGYAVGSVVALTMLVLTGRPGAGGHSAPAAP